MNPYYHDLNIKVNWINIYRDRWMAWLYRACKSKSFMVYWRVFEHSEQKVTTFFVVCVIICSVTSSWFGNNRCICHLFECEMDGIQSIRTMMCCRCCVLLFRMSLSSALITLVCSCEMHSLDDAFAIYRLHRPRINYFIIHHQYIKKAQTHKHTYEKSAQNYSRAPNTNTFQLFLRSFVVVGRSCDDHHSSWLNS